MSDYLNYPKQGERESMERQRLQSLTILIIGFEIVRFQTDKCLNFQNRFEGLWDALLVVSVQNPLNGSFVRPADLQNALKNMAIEAILDHHHALLASHRTPQALQHVLRVRPKRLSSICDLRRALLGLEFVLRGCGVRDLEWLFWTISL
jgi:hypothetical protein